MGIFYDAKYAVGEALKKLRKVFAEAPKIIFGFQVSII